MKCLTVPMATFTYFCKQKRRAKQREEHLQSRYDELDFSRVPYSDSKANKSGRLFVTIIEAGNLPVLINDNRIFRCEVVPLETRDLKR